MKHKVIYFNCCSEHTRVVAEFETKEEALEFVRGEASVIFDGNLKYQEPN